MLYHKANSDELANNCSFIVLQPWPRPDHTPKKENKKPHGLTYFCPVLPEKLINFFAWPKPALNCNIIHMIAELMYTYLSRIEAEQ